MNVKKMLQAPLRSRQRAKYEARIKEQTVRYHDWIVKKEEKEREARGTDARKDMYGVLCPSILKPPYLRLS